MGTFDGLTHMVWGKVGVDPKAISVKRRELYEVHRQLSRRCVTSSPEHSGDTGGRQAYPGAWLWGLSFTERVIVVFVIVD